MRLNATGSAVYGAGQIHLNGATPAALSGFTANQAQWLTDTQIIFQDYTGSPVLKTYDTGTLAVATVSPFGANSLGAGGGVWWAYGTQVRTSISGVGPFPQAGLTLPLSSQVSETGIAAIIQSRSTGRGIQCYSATGTLLWTLDVQLAAGPPIVARAGLCAYKDPQGGHLVTLAAGTPVPVAVRTETINWTIPVRLGTNTDVVIERSERLTLRKATATTGYILESTPTTYNPDAREIAPGIVRVGWCTNAGESLGSLVLLDVNVNNGTATRGTVSGGTIVWAGATTLPLTPLPSTGAIDGGSGLAAELTGIYQQPVTDRNDHLTPPWYRWLLKLAAHASVVDASRIRGVLPPSAGGTGTGTGTTILNADNLTAGTVPQAAKWTETTLTLTGQQDNVAFGAADFLRCANAALLTLDGLAAGVPGQRLVLVATDADVTLVHQSAFSAYVNRLWTADGLDVTLPADAAALLEYDGTDARWRVLFVSTPSPVDIEHIGYWNPLMTGGGATSELILTSDGDAIMVFTRL